MRLYLFFLLLVPLAAKEICVARTQVIMGTFATIALPYSQYFFAQKGFKRLKAIELELSTFNKDAALYRLNHEHILVNRYDYLRQALDISKNLYRMTEGYFNPFVGQLTKNLYRFGMDIDFIVSDTLLLKNRPKAFDIDTTHYYLESQKDEIIDLGGMGKGFALDKLKAFFDAQSIHSYKVALSGDIYCKGNCTLGIQSPFKKSATIVEVEINNSAISTSGSYERTISATNIDHLLDVKNFHKKDLLSLTLISSKFSNALLDGLATALSVMPSKKRDAFLKKYPQLSYLYIDTKGVCYFNEGFLKLVRTQSFFKKCPNQIKKQ